MKFAFIPLLLSFIFISCKKEDPAVEQAKEDDAIIRQYITDNNLDAYSTNSGLYYVVHEYGLGNKPNANSRLTVKYKGYFTNGEVFDQHNALSFYLGQVIDGWQEGLPLFNKGGKGILLIPSHLGYGPDGSGSIPGNKVLIFDIEILKVEN